MVDRPVLVTGAAGFIGFHLARRLLADGFAVVGFDNVNDYYDPALKEARLRLLEAPGFTFVRNDVADRDAVERAFAEHRPGAVLHMAAQAGVRYSLTHPHAYAAANLTGFLNILEGCRNHSVNHLVYASSSSVYGANTRTPFSEQDNVDHPVSLYAATKKANEAMAHSYSHLYGIPTTGLRFFTVYGPWGRPDMALFLFTRAILEGRAIDVFNRGRMKRDFTYIDDIVEGVVRVLAKPATENPEWSGADPDPATSLAPWRIYNIGNHRPVTLERFIAVLEEALGHRAVQNLLPLQPGDVLETAAEIRTLREAVGFEPSTPIEVGIPKFVAWYREFYAC